MIVTHVFGGLGNQLFQYAVGRSLSLRTGHGLVWDDASFQAYSLRRFLLDRYSVHGRRASCLESLVFKVRPRRLARASLPLIGVYLDEERQHSYQEIRVPTRFRGLCLRGYWQSERYFSDHADVIRKDLVLKVPPAGRNAEMLREIQACEAVAVHIRRGDYVSNPVTAAVHGACGMDYYREGLSRLDQVVTRPHLYVFSDDIPWVRENLKTSHPVTYVDHNSADEPCEDLRLMSACKHFVIANSSFSWWGAWLSAFPGKRVVAPKRWFATDSKDSRDQVPDSWIRI